MYFYDFIPIFYVMYPTFAICHFGFQKPHSYDLKNPFKLYFIEFSKFIHKNPTV